MEYILAGMMAVSLIGVIGEKDNEKREALAVCYVAAAVCIVFVRFIGMW